MLGVCVSVNCTLSVTSMYKCYMFKCYMYVQVLHAWSYVIH